MSLLGATPDPNGEAPAMNNNHHADDLFGNDIVQQLTYDAAINASVTGSIGSTSRREYRNARGELISEGSQSVERIAVPAGYADAVMSSCAWRNKNSGIVVVLPRLRNTSHAAAEAVAG